MPLPTLMFKCWNAYIHNIPLQEFLKAKCLCFGLLGFKLTLFYNLKLNSVLNTTNVLLVLLSWSHWQCFFYFEYLICLRDIPRIMLIIHVNLAIWSQCKFYYQLEYQGFIVINQDRIENFCSTSLLILLEMLLFRNRLWKSV